MFADCFGLLRNVGRHPLRKRNLAICMATRCRVLLLNLSELLRREALGEPNQRGPQPSMNQGDLPVNQPTDKDFLRLADGFENPVDLAALRVRPPTALDRLADDGLRETRRGSPG